MDFDIMTGLLIAGELSCVEMEKNVCTDAHMEFDIIYVYFPHMTDFPM